MTMIASHVLLLCLHLWRSVISGNPAAKPHTRGDGPRLVGNFLQMVELHYRDGWPISRYAAALGVTEDRLHAHCKREKTRSPRAIVHERLIHEACTRLQQLDLPVEQIGYGLGFRDPAISTASSASTRASRPAPIGVAQARTGQTRGRFMRPGRSVRTPKYTGVGSRRPAGHFDFTALDRDGGLRKSFQQFRIRFRDQQGDVGVLRAQAPQRLGVALRQHRRRGPETVHPE